MMIPSNYEINVAYCVGNSCVHFCKIELGQTLPELAKQKFHELRRIFPEDYKLTLEQIECYGKPIEEA